MSNYVFSYAFFFVIKYISRISAYSLLSVCCFVVLNARYFSCISARLNFDLRPPAQASAMRLRMPSYMRYSPPIPWLLKLRTTRKIFSSQYVERLATPCRSEGFGSNHDVLTRVRVLVFCVKRISLLDIPRCLAHVFFPWGYKCIRLVMKNYGTSLTYWLDVGW